MPETVVLFFYARVPKRPAREAEKAEAIQGTRGSIRIRLRTRGASSWTASPSRGYLSPQAPRTVPMRCRASANPERTRVP